MFSYEHVMMSSGQRSSLCHPSYFTNKKLYDYKFFQEHQQKSRRFPVFPGKISNSRRFPVFPVLPGVVDTLLALRFTEPDLLQIKVLHRGNGDFWPFFAAVTLTLTRWPSYMNLTRILWRHTVCAKLNFLRQDFRKSCRHTDKTEIIYQAALRVVNNRQQTDLDAS